MTLSRPTLKRGSRGASVIDLQYALNDTTFGLEALVPDGIFGGRTDSAVRLFQAQNTLVEDGIVGPNTWGVLDRLTAELEKKATRQPPRNHLPLQTTIDDCGYYAGYCIAKALERGSFDSLGFGSDDVMAAKQRFLTANHLPDVYLGPHNAGPYLQSLNTPGYLERAVGKVFTIGSDDVEALRYLVQRIGDSCIMIAVWTFTNRSGHWFTILSWKRTDDDNVLFLIYDSSGMIPRDRQKAGHPAGKAVCWVGGKWLIAHLRLWNVAGMIARQ